MKDTKSEKKLKTKKTSVSEDSVKVPSEKDTNDLPIEKKEVSKKKKKHSRIRLYFSYEKRLFINVVLLAVFLALSLFCARKTLTKEDTDPINYTEKETIDYKVYLKENDFYSEKYLPKDRAYIASLIDYIELDLKYLFNIERLTTMNVDYKVIGELVIENSSGANRYYEKEYTIVDTKNRKLKGTNELEIIEHTKISYDYYNELANKFRSSYGVDTNSYLNIYIVLDKETDSSLNYSIKESRKVDNITIPLSQRAIEIKINSTANSITKSVIPKPIIKVNIPYLTGEVVAFFVAAFALVKIVKYVTLMFKRMTIYDRYVNKLLKDYDRLIIEINTDMDFSKYNVIEVNKFNELLDVRDNIKMPINYYNITEHEKGVFFIKNNDDVYLLTLKNIDLTSKDLKKI